MIKRILLIVCLFVLTSTDCFSATTFVPRLTIREEYTDNLDLAPDNERADWITTIAPGGSLEFRGRTAGLLLDYEPSYALYSRYSENDTLRHRGVVELWSELSRRTRFHASNITMVTDEPLSEFDTTIRTGREDYLSSITNANLYHQFGREDLWNLGYTYEMLDNEDEEIENTQRHEPYLILTFWPLENEWGTETTLRYRKGLYDESDDFDFYSGGLRIIRRFNQNVDGFIRYTYSTMDFEGITEDYNLHEVGPGLSYDIDEDTNISLEFIYLFRDRETSNDEDRFLFVSEIYKRWLLSRSTIVLNGSSGYQPDTFGAENIGFNLFAELDAIYEFRLTRQARWDIFGRARYDEYTDVEPERVDNTFRTGTGFSYQALSWAEWRLEYTYRQVFSDIFEYEYTENRAMLQLTLMPGLDQVRDSDRSEREGRDRMDQRNIRDTRDPRGVPVDERETLDQPENRQ